MAWGNVDENQIVFSCSILITIFVIQWVPRLQLRRPVIEQGCWHFRMKKLTIEWISQLPVLSRHCVKRNKEKQTRNSDDVENSRPECGRKKISTKLKLVNQTLVYREERSWPGKEMESWPFARPLQKLQNWFENSEKFHPYPCTSVHHPSNKCQSPFKLITFFPSFFFQVCQDDENVSSKIEEDNSTAIKLEDAFDLGRTEVIDNVKVYEAVRRSDNKPVTLFASEISTKILGYKKPIRQFSALTN